MRYGWVMRTSLLYGVLAITLLVAACDDDVTSPPLGSLSRLWPDDEGRGWNYTGSWSYWDSDMLDSAYVFDHADDVPDFPGWETILAYLDDVPTRPVTDGGTYSYELRFEGTLNVTPSLAVRNLQMTYDGMDLVFCGEDTSVVPASFLKLMGSVPDLQRRMSRILGTNSFGWPPNNLIHGGPFERTADWLGTYACIDSLPFWTFLEGDVRPGATFTKQLFRSSIEGIYLHGRVRGQTSIDTPAGRFDAVEVDYAVDYGILEYTDAGNTEPWGYGRVLLLGKVFYAIDVGPVASVEWNVVPVGENGLGVGIGTVTLDLVSTTNPSPS